MVESATRRPLISQRMRGAQRDQRILELLERARYMTAEQIRRVVFADVRHPQKCQERLLKLVRRGQLKRQRRFRGDRYVYYLDKWSSRAEHYVGLNWVRAHYAEHIHAWVYEYYCEWPDGALQADALMVLKGPRLSPVFVEMDRGSNPFDKVPKYTAYYRSAAWVSQWWAEASKDGEEYRFPGILVATTRPEPVRRQIEAENDAKLRFRVVSLEQAV